MGSLSSLSCIIANSLPHPFSDPNAQTRFLTCIFVSSVPAQTTCKLIGSESILSNTHYHAFDIVHDAVHVLVDWVVTQGKLLHVSGVLADVQGFRVLFKIDVVRFFIWRCWWYQWTRWLLHRRRLFSFSGLLWMTQAGLLLVSTWLRGVLRTNCANLSIWWINIWLIYLK